MRRLKHFMSMTRWLKLMCPPVMLACCASEAAAAAGPVDAPGRGAGPTAIDFEART